MISSTPNNSTYTPTKENRAALMLDLVIAALKRDIDNYPFVIGARLPDEEWDIMVNAGVSLFSNKLSLDGYLDKLNKVLKDISHGEIQLTSDIRYHLDGRIKMFTFSNNM